MAAFLETRARAIEFCVKVFIVTLFLAAFSVPILVIYLPSGPSPRNLTNNNSVTASPFTTNTSCPATSSSSSTQPSTMGKTNTTERLAKLRKMMRNVNVVPEVLQAFIVPTDDAHQNEYIAAADQRREYISGFTGSAGTAVITEHHAGLWTDGRYFLQAEAELDADWVLVKDRLPDTPTFGQWLNEKLPVSSAVGVDSKTISTSNFEILEKELKKNGNRLVFVGQNLIDLVWEDRPPPPSEAVTVLGVEFAGKEWREKVADVRGKMREMKADFFVVTALDEIAWLLNLRGSDIPYNPVFFAYVIVGNDSIMLFLNENKTTAAVLAHLNISSPDAMDTDMKVELYPYDDIFQKLDEIVHQPNEKKIWVTSESSYAICSRVPVAFRHVAASPITLMKSIKNSVELEGMFKAHVRDGAALAEFFAWLEKEVPNCNVTELSASDKLEEIRRQEENFVSLSFSTISGSGPNGAVIHYKATPESNRFLNLIDLFLVDSGSQYLEGTTDVTRTVHFGSPSQFEKECFTLVLKGNLALAMAHFPERTTGQRLDTLARMPLWSQGLDYPHGTGHGVGSYLNVHEGPMSISFRHNPNDPGLMEGMVVTDEPGFYEAGAFGIRIENQMVVEGWTPNHSNSNNQKNQKNQKKLENKFLQFRNLTLVPFQRKLFVAELLTKEEINFIDKYHADCLTHVGEALKKAGKMDAYRWLVKETLPIG